jgi:hypothetical protein
METSELQRVRELEAENSRLKMIVRDRLGHHCFEGVGSKKTVSTRDRRPAVEYPAAALVL